MKIENMKADSRFAKGFGVYVMSDAEARAAWTGESIEQAAAALAAEANVNTVKIRTGANVIEFKRKG